MPKKDLTAALALYKKTTAKTTAVPAPSGLQARAWEEYQLTPEVRFAANWIANAMSRARLKAGKLLPDGTIEEAKPTDRAAELVAAIAGGRDGQSELLRLMGLHLVVAGEGWIVIVPRENVDGEDWHVISVLEVKAGTSMKVKVRGKELTVKPDEDESNELHLDGPIPIRVWQPSPARFLEADSPVIGSLSHLEELRLLGASVKSTARSRLAGRGVILFPTGTRFPVAPGNGEAEDDLIDIFMEVAETAIQQPESAAASVPVILEVPVDAIGKIQHITFESEFDKQSRDLRDEQIRRFANALDIPADLLTGQGALNHWSLWAQQSEAVQLGVEPRLTIVTQALTDAWLRPLLEAETSPEEAAQWVTWADTSDLRTPTNRAQTAIEVYDRGVISPEALRRETGFEESDAPKGPLPAPPGKAGLTTGPHAEPEGGKSSTSPQAGEKGQSEGADHGGEGQSVPESGKSTSLPVSETGAPPNAPEPTASAYPDSPDEWPVIGYTTADGLAMAGEPR